MISKVHHPEGKHFRFLRHLRGELRLAESHAQLTGVAGVIIEPLDGVGEHVGAFSIRSKERTDCIVRAYLFQVHNGRLHITTVNGGAIAVLRQVTLGRADAFQELIFKRFFEKLFGQLHHASCVLNDLHGFNAG